MRVNKILLANPYNSPDVIVAGQQGNGIIQDVGKLGKRAYNWARQKKILTKLDNGLERFTPEVFKSNPVYGAVRTVTKTGKQLGIGDVNAGNQAPVIVVEQKKPARKKPARKTLAKKKHRRR